MSIGRPEFEAALNRLYQGQNGGYLERRIREATSNDYGIHGIL